MDEEQQRLIENLRQLNEIMPGLIAAMAAQTKSVNDSLGVQNNATKATKDATNATNADAEATKKATQNTYAKTAAQEMEAEAAKKAAEANQNFAKAGAAAQASLIGLKNAILDTTVGFGKYGQVVSGAGDAAFALGKNFGILGTVLGGVIKGFSMVVEAGMKQADNALKLKDEIGKVGAIGAGTAQDLIKMANAAGYTAAEYQKLTKPIKSIGEGLVSLGGTAGEGAKEFMKMAAVGSDVRQQFSRLGVSQEELTQRQADYVKMQALSGKSLAGDAQSREKLKKESLAYAENLTRLSALTGEDADALAKKQQLAMMEMEELVKTREEDVKIRELREAGRKDEADNLKAQQDARKQFIKEAVSRFGTETGTQLGRVVRTGGFDQFTAGLATLGVNAAQLSSDLKNAKPGEETKALFNRTYDDVSKKVDQASKIFSTSIQYQGKELAAATGLNNELLQKTGQTAATTAEQMEKDVKEKLEKAKSAGTDPAADARAKLTEVEISARVKLDELVASMNPLLGNFNAGTVAAGALAAAAGVAAIALTKMAATSAMSKAGDLLGKGGGRGGADAAKTAAKAGAGTLGKMGASAAGLLSGAAKAAPVIGTVAAVGAGGYQAYTGYKDVEQQRKEGKITEKEATVKKSEAVGEGVGTAAGGAGGAWAGAAAGAAIGSVVPVVGTAIGGILGAAIGGWLGAKGGEIVGKNVGTAAGNAMSSDKVAKAAGEGAKAAAAGEGAKAAGEGAKAATGAPVTPATPSKPETDIKPKTLEQPATTPSKPTGAATASAKLPPDMETLLAQSKTVIDGRSLDPTKFGLDPKLLKDFKTTTGDSGKDALSVAHGALEKASNELDKVGSPFRNFHDQIEQTTKLFASLNTTTIRYTDSLNRSFTSLNSFTKQFQEETEDIFDEDMFKNQTEEVNKAMKRMIGSFSIDPSKVKFTMPPSMQAATTGGKENAVYTVNGKPASKEEYQKAMGQINAVHHKIGSVAGGMPTMSQKSRDTGGMSSGPGASISTGSRQTASRPAGGTFVGSETQLMGMGKDQGDFSRSSVPGSDNAPKVAKAGGGGGGMSEEDIKKMIIQHEGIRTKPYKDSLGLWTVGVGHLIGDGKTLPDSWNREFSMEEVMKLFEEDYAHHRQAAEKIPGFDKLDSTGQGALTDLTFNMGPAWYKRWPNFTKALGQGDTDRAADSLRDSKWYTQVGNRAPTITGLIEKAQVVAKNGAMIEGPETGYPVDLTAHGKEIIAPLTPNSILEKISKLSVEEFKRETDTPPQQPQIIEQTPSVDLSELVAVNMELKALMEDKLDTMIDKLDASVNLQDKLYKNSV